MDGLVASPQRKMESRPNSNQNIQHRRQIPWFPQFFQCQLVQPFIFQRFGRVSAGFRCYLRGHRQVQCDLVLRSSAMASAQRAQQWQQCAQVMQQFREEKNHGDLMGLDPPRDLIFEDDIFFFGIHPVSLSLGFGQTCFGPFLPLRVMVDVGNTPQVCRCLTCRSAWNPILWFLDCSYVTLVLVPYQETWKVNICRPT